MHLEVVTQVRLSDQVYSQLKRSILLGEYGSDPITESELAAQLEVSRTPLREALGALSAEGWVTRLPGGGIRAIQISLTEIHDAIAARADLEARIAQYASVRATTEDLRRLERTLADADKGLAIGALQDVATKNKNFHQQIAESTGSRVLVKLFETVYDYSVAGGTFGRHSQHQSAQSRIERLQQVSKTHAEILQAIVGRHRALAAARMRAHIEEVMSAYRLVGVGDGGIEQSETGAGSH